MCISQCISINLIKNPSLEEYTCCPTNMTMIECANYWTQPWTGPNSTSDYFNNCGIDSLQLPQLFIFFKNAYFSNGYAGIICDDYHPGDPPLWDYREYLQGTLSDTLKEGQCYYCEFWVKPFNFNNESAYSTIDAISIYYSDTLPQKSSIFDNTMLFFLPAQVNNATGRVITDTNKWTKISDTFTASGKEFYFTVGTFKQPNQVNVINFGTPIQTEAYYFFDNFSLCPCDDTIPPQEPETAVYIPNIFSPNSDGNNDVFLVRSENIETIHLAVYNRWGEKVFESQNPNEGWDGNYKGKPCSPDVYVYHATIMFEDGTETSRKGNVTLVR